MELIVPNAYELAHEAERRAYAVLIQAELALDVRQRQRSVLARTFPDWDVSFGPDLFGALVWRAERRDPLTLELVTAGALMKVERRNPIDLMTALTLQAWIIQSRQNP